MSRRRTVFHRSFFILLLGIILFWPLSVLAQGVSFFPSATTAWDTSMYFPYTSYSSSDRYWPVYSSYTIGQTDASWLSSQGFTRFIYPSAYSGFEGGYQYLFGGWSMYSGVPQGCTLRLDERRCTSRGACHTPLYCPVYIPSYF